jgi:hypothetical protein
MFLRQLDLLTRPIRVIKEFQAVSDFPDGAPLLEEDLYSLVVFRAIHSSTAACPLMLSGYPGVTKTERGCRSEIESRPSMGNRSNSDVIIAHQYLGLQFSLPQTRRRASVGIFTAITNAARDIGIMTAAFPLTGLLPLELEAKFMLQAQLPNSPATTVLLFS